jgi:Ca2+-binding EF-hand superfamily protein
MKTTLVQALAIAAAAATTAFAALPAQAQDVRREEMVTYFQMDHIDKDKDGMVSKKEFMDAMSKTWDMHMAEAKKADAKMPKDKMTLQQYLEFSKMFGLNVGG